MITYFAYGSNMCSARMRSRVSEATHAERARLRGHVLRWHKASKDGSGKCDAFFTGRAEDEILGVVYRIPEGQKTDLDRAEGLGHGYQEKAVHVLTEDGDTLDAVMYAAASHAIDPHLLPYEWYKEYVLCGANDQSLPQAYIDRLEQQASVTDPDLGRAER